MIIIIDKFKLGMSFNELKRFIEECEISVTEDEIKKFLDKKMKTTQVQKLVQIIMEVLF